jgi:PKD domain/Bacterial Ig-like domain (group 1)
MRKLPLGVISVVVAVITAACAADLPSSPEPTPLPKAGTPTTLELAITPGIGDQGGTAAISVHVLDAFGAPVVSLPVALTSTAGTISPAQVTTDGAGRATAFLQAAPGSVTVTASIANGPTRSAPVAVQPLPPPLPTPTPAPTPAPTPEPPRPPLTVTIFITPQAAGQPTTFSLATQAIASAAWDFGDSATLTTTTPFTSHVYGAGGSYPVTVIVRDSQGRTASASATAVIPAAAPVPAPPSSALVTFSCTVAPHGSNTVCNVSATLDGHEATTQLEEVAWLWGDGKRNSNPLPGQSVAISQQHNYAQAGTYTIEVQARFNTGVTATAQKTITVP